MSSPESASERRYGVFTRDDLYDIMDAINLNATDATRDLQDLAIRFDLVTIGRLLEAYCNALDIYDEEARVVAEAAKELEDSFRILHGGKEVEGA